MRDHWVVDGYLGEVLALPLPMDILCLGRAPPLIQNRRQLV